MLWQSLIDFSAVIPVLCIKFYQYIYQCNTNCLHKFKNKNEKKSRKMCIEMNGNLFVTTMNSMS
jgi:hypothetical protein